MLSSPIIPPLLEPTALAAGVARTAQLKPAASAVGSVSGRFNLVVPTGFGSSVRLSASRCRWRLVMPLVVACLAFAASSASADKPSPALQLKPAEFLERFCIECHLADDPSGEREFESLDFAKSDLDTQRAVQEIIDQLTLATMPPEESDRPSTEERLAAIDAFTQRLTKMRQQTASTGGKTVLRRLSKREYRRTIGDLLAIDMTMFDPTIEFPSDNLSGHFDNIGDALVTSGHLLERYLEAADRSVEKALAISDKPEQREWLFKDGFFQQPEVARGHKVAFNNRYLCLYDHPYTDKPEGAYGHISSFDTGVPVDGIYEIRVLAKAMNRDTPYSKQAVRIDLDEPFRMGVRPGDTSIGDMVHTQPIQPLLAETLVSGDEFRWYTFRVPLDQGFAPRFTFENGIHDFRGSIGRVFRLHKGTLPKKIQNKKGIFEQRIALIQHGRMPHIRIDEVQVRGPVDYSWPTACQKVLLGDDGLVGEIGMAKSKIESQLEDFASRAFRRPATQQEVQGFLNLLDARRKDGRDLQQAYQDTLKAVLCSPSFLYFKQPAPGTQSRLSDHALAERLAYFLTSTLPDERLRELADRGEISDPETLRREVRRLLTSEASDAFIADFLDSWLNLRSLGTMPPDPNEFWFFYAAELQQDMKRETQLFLRDLIDRDASVAEMISGNHSFLNRDLAKLYGVVDQVEADKAHEFRRVTFEDASRGGLLGQASILTVSANGIETSPVVRGVWLLENILGTPPPPPPDNVPAIEPDTRGALSIRDQLTKHRNDDACYQCHRKIDPLGFALEGFDAIGQSRAFYDSKRKHAIDTSGTLPGGETFSGTAELKQRLLKRKSFFVRTFTEQLLTHALGRRIEPDDRAAVDAILAEVRDQDYPTAKLIETIVMSDMFHR